jgi:hypothetical protein
MGTSRKRGNKKGAAKTYKIGKEGGGVSPGTITQLVASQIQGPAPAQQQQPVGVNSGLTKAAAPVGGAPVKVVLTAAKKKKGKVVLAAAKAVAPLAHGKTRKLKVARKVRVSMAGLSRKINKARIIRQKATGDSIEDVKKELEKAGLIKKESKAPEPMLRQMYADFMMLKKRAL